MVTWWHYVTVSQILNLKKIYKITSINLYIRKLIAHINFYNNTIQKRCVYNTQRAFICARTEIASAYSKQQKKTRVYKYCEIFIQLFSLLVGAHGTHTPCAIWHILTAIHNTRYVLVFQSRTNLIIFFFPLRSKRFILQWSQCC